MKTYITEIDGKWYAYGADANKNQVYSIGRDDPSDGGKWFAKWNDAGVKYVSSPSSTREAAYRRARCNGEYGGVV